MCVLVLGQSIATAWQSFESILQPTFTKMSRVPDAALLSQYDEETLFVPYLKCCITTEILSMTSGRVQNRSDRFVRSQTGACLDSLNCLNLSLPASVCYIQYLSPWISPFCSMSLFLHLSILFNFFSCICLFCSISLSVSLHSSSE